MLNGWSNYTLSNNAESAIFRGSCAASSSYSMDVRCLTNSVQDTMPGKLAPDSDSGWKEGLTKYEDGVND